MNYARLRVRAYLGTPDVMRNCFGTPAINSLLRRRQWLTAITEGTGINIATSVRARAIGTKMIHVARGNRWSATTTAAIRNEAAMAAGVRSRKEEHVTTAAMAR